MRKLVILTGRSKGQSFDLAQATVSIGRADENNIVLEDDEVSRRHVLLTYDGAEYKLRDIGSRNGTRVNNKPILETKLVPGDTVQMGAVEIRYEAEGMKLITPPGATPADVERVKQLQTEIEHLTTQNRELNARMTTAQQQLTDAQKQAALRGATELPKSDADLTKLRADLELARQAATQVTALQAEKQALAAQLTTAQNQMVEVQRRADSQVQTMVLERQQLEKQLETSRQQLTDERRQGAEREAAVRQKGEVEVAGVRAELQRTTSELTTTKQELEETKKLAVRVEELTAQNRALESQLTGTKQELTKAHTDLNAAWQDVAIARQRIAEQERHGGDATKLGAELEKMRQQVVEAKQAAARVEDLQKERDRLATQLTGVEQEMINARDQAARESQTAEKLRTELAQVRSDLDVAKKETSKIVVRPPTAPGTLGARPAVEVQRLTAELAETQTRLKEVSVELTKTRSELEHMRKDGGRPLAVLAPAPTSAPAPTPAPVGIRNAAPLVSEPPTVVAKPARPATTDLTARRHLFEEQIATFEKNIAESEKLFPGKETDELKRWKADLAVARANLYNVVMPKARARHSEPRPVVTEARPVLAAPPRPGMSTAMLAGLAALAVVVLGAMVWLYANWSRPSPLPSAPPPTRARPDGTLTPPRIITEPQIPSLGIAPGEESPAPSTEWEEYRDPDSRFTCGLPPGWTVEAVPAANESRLKLTSGKEVIHLLAHGTDWPALVDNDRVTLEGEFMDRLRILYPSGLYGQMTHSSWRTMEDQPALAMQSTITLDKDNVMEVLAVQYRKDGRTHTIEIHVSSPDQLAVQALLFEKFLGQYHSASETTLPW